MTLPLSRCRSCGKAIYWLPTKAGNSIPVNAAGVDAEKDTVFDFARHVSHFADCPEANSWRRRKGK